MKKPLWLYLVLVVAVCLFGTGVTAMAGPEENSPNLLAAMKALQEAKTADDPNPKLKEALEDLNKATNNRGGNRDKAIALVNEATQLASNPDKTEMVSKIDHAIADLHMGMSEGGHHRR